MTRLAGRVALVTGGRSGIGRAIARRLAAEGARVFTAQRGTDVEAEGIAADLADAEAPARVVAEVAAKAGLHGLTRAVAVDHGAEGVWANAVAPGWIETDLNAGFVAGQPDPEAFRAGLGRIHPLGRTGGP